MNNPNSIREISENLGMSPGRRWRARLAWLAVILAMTAAATAALMKWQASAAGPAFQYRTQEARRGNLTVTVTATGTLQPTKTVTVGSEVSGIIDEVLVDYNDRVSVGQVLARINTEKLDAQVLQDKASLETARAKVRDAEVTVVETEAEYKRIQTLRERSNGQVPSQHDLDTASASYERAKVAVLSAKAAVSQAEATLAMDQTNVSKAVIKSSVNGIVLARNVQAGQTIASSFNVASMFELAEDIRRMNLQVSIDEADMGQVKEDQPVGFTVDAFPGRVFPGKIRKLRYQSTTSNNVVTYLADITVDNRELLLRPGMTATATITVQSVKDVLLVPNVALRFTPPVANGGQQTDQRSLFQRLMPGPPPRSVKTAGEDDSTGTGPRVWVLRGDQPSPVAVTTRATNGKVTEILSGPLAAGVPVIIESLKVTK